MVTKRMSKSIRNFIFELKVKNKLLVPLFMIFILLFSLLPVYYHIEGNSSNLSLLASSQLKIDYSNDNFGSGLEDHNSVQNISSQAPENYTLPIYITSLIQNISTEYCYQQFIVLNRTLIPEINSNFSNFYFSYTNGTRIYSWIMNSTVNIANIWLRLNFHPTLTIYLNIGPKNLSLFGNSSFVGYARQYFNAPLVFGNTTSPYAWDFAGAHLPNGFINYFTRYIVNNGLYIFGKTAHYAKIELLGNYNNNTGILTNIQISQNGHTNIRQTFDYKIKGQEESLTNFWFINGSQFAFATEDRGPTNNTGIYNNYSYNVIGINDSLNTNLACGTFNNLVFSGTNTPISNASYFSDFTYCLGGSYDEQYANYSWVIIRTLPPDNIMPSYFFGKIQQTYTVIFLAKNLPNQSPWSINITHSISTETFSSIQPKFVINIPNGTYSFVVGNSSKYYPIQTKGIFQLDGKSVIILIPFAEFASLNVTITPPTSVLTINGNIVYPSAWIYKPDGFLESSIHNKLLKPGYYTLIVKDSGYHSFSENIRLTSGELLVLNVTLTHVKNNAIP